MSKRVPVQYHLALHTGPTYQGLSLIHCRNGFVREYLARLYETIAAAVNRHSKVLAIRVDLHFPQYYGTFSDDVLSNDYLSKFIKVLRRRLRHHGVQKHQSGQRIHNPDFEYVWAREYGPTSSKPHFHFLLLFNGHAFNTLGDFSSDHESLFNRIGESWGEALGIHVAEGCKFTHYPEGGSCLIKSRDPEGVEAVFRRASYLAKVESKRFDDGYHVFGGSRL